MKKKICHEEEVRFTLAESRGTFMKNKFTQTFLVNCVLRKFIISNNLFLNLKEHSYDQNPLENHI